MSRKLKIVERKLGREKSWGICHKKLGLIEIDPRLSAPKYLHVFVHELVHYALPDFSESKARKIARIISNGLWDHIYKMNKNECKEKRYEKTKIRN